MTTIQFVLIMAWFGLALAALAWVSYQSSSPRPSRGYTAVASRVDVVFTVLSRPLDWVLARWFQ